MAQAKNYFGEEDQYYSFLEELDGTERYLLHQIREKEMRRKHWIKDNDFSY